MLKIINILIKRCPNQYAPLHTKGKTITMRTLAAKRDINTVKADLIDRLPEKKTLEDFRSLSQKQLVDGPNLKVTFDSSLSLHTHPIS